jgi:hypothetical protein
MEHTKHTQKSQDIFSQQSFTPNGGQPLRGVGQDKSVPQRDRIASRQPVTLQNTARSHQLNTNPSRSQKGNTSNRKTVPLMLWVKPRVKAELTRIAEREGLSMSATGGALLEEALRQNLYSQHTALLEPLIEKAIRKHMRSYSNRIAVLLVRSIFAGEQTRSLVTNILGRQDGVSQPVLEEILNRSSSTAKRNITRITPQLTELVAAIEMWLEEGEKTHA